MLQLLAAVLAFAILLVLPSASSRAADPSDAFNAMIAAAKAEGAVTVDGPPIDAVRDALTNGFQKKYGIAVSYISSGSGPSGARVRAERAAGKYLLDVFVSGSDTPIMTFLPSGWLDRIEPILIEPDSVNPKLWKDGHVWYADPQKTILRTMQYVAVELAVNTRLVQPKDIPTWKSLLDPKWKGKLLVKDPTLPGSGQSLNSYFYINFGPDFVHKLYIDQKPTFSVGGEWGQLETFRKIGYPIEPVTPSDGPGILTGSFGLVNLMNKAPHPNAAKLYVNWIASREGETLFAKALLSASLRVDMKQDWMPSFELTHPGGKYYDAYDYKFITVERNAALEKFKALLGL